MYTMCTPASLLSISSSSTSPFQPIHYNGNHHRLGSGETASEIRKRPVTYMTHRSATPPMTSLESSITRLLIINQGPRIFRRLNRVQRSILIEHPFAPIMTDSSTDSNRKLGGIWGAAVIHVPCVSTPSKNTVPKDDRNRTLTTSSPSPVTGSHPSAARNP
ncbi:hypothetical protein B0T13DRAFT_157621 [Neurospora crassa]|nr:hypothetical protein B0T13DRAFT_157621 [Neurospora crassa]